MNLDKLKVNWELMAKADPLYGVLSHEGKQGGKWDEKEFFETGEREIEELQARLKAIPAALPKGKALDFGCGVGRISQALCPHFDEVVGVDISSAMLSKAEAYNKFGARCRYVLNEDAYLKPFKDCEFDFVYSNIVLQHMAPELALGYVAEFVRVLKQGGAGAFFVPERAEDSALRRLLRRLAPKPLVRAYRKMKYGAAATDADIEMNGVAAPKVIQAVAAAGGEALSFQPGWYWVTK